MTRHEQSTPEEPPVVVRDRRKIDPVTGEVRHPDPAAGTADTAGAAGAEQGGAAAAGPATGSAPAEAGELGELRGQLTERTSDLQRITAEFANYRRRVERDREAVGASAKANVVTELLGVLDDIERAGAHGDLNGAFKSVADKLTDTLGKIGLVAFGSEGDPFDPAVHQAVQHATSPDVDGPTVTAVLRRGYQLGDRLLRTAMVAVTDHEPSDAGAAGGGGGHDGNSDPGGPSGNGGNGTAGAPTDRPLWSAPGGDDPAREQARHERR